MMDLDCGRWNLLSLVLILLHAYGVIDNKYFIELIVKLCHAFRFQYSVDTDRPADRQGDRQTGRQTDSLLESSALLELNLATTRCMGLLLSEAWNSIKSTRRTSYS